MIDDDVKHIKDSMALLNAMIRNGEYPTKESDKKVNKAFKITDNLMTKIGQTIQANLFNFIDWLKIWEIDKNLDDYTINEIYDEYKNR